MNSNTKQGITALPWRIKQGGHLPKNIIKILADDPLFGVATVLWKIPEDAAQCEANAAYIVLAVNAHEKLVELLRELAVSAHPHVTSLSLLGEALVAIPRRDCWADVCDRLAKAQHKAEQLLRDLEASK